MTVTIRRYTPQDRERWNSFVRSSKNGTFLFEREFMEYHADRFDDFSLIAEKDGAFFALLPANRSGITVHSHQGLSYGGWLVNSSATIGDYSLMFNAGLAYLKAQGVETLIYKCIPRFYQTLPADEDLYCIFRSNGSLIRRDLATVIDLASPVPYSSQRKRNIAKAKKAGISVCQSTEIESFHALLSDVLLSRHQTNVVHSADELRMLMTAFPDNIKLFFASDKDGLCAATLVFETPTVVHTQYLANSERGRICGALDYLLDNLIREVYKDKAYFSFGISTEESGRYLNEGLASQKEGFGGRSVVHDFYSLKCDVSLETPSQRV